jgi:hypothetical protein
LPTLAMTGTGLALAQHEVIGNTHYLGQIDFGGQPFFEVAKGIERFASRFEDLPGRNNSTRRLMGEPSRASSRTLFQLLESDHTLNQIVTTGGPHVPNE